MWALLAAMPLLLEADMRAVKIANDGYVRMFDGSQGVTGGLPSATADAYNRPIAVHHKGMYDRTYVVYQNYQGKAMILYYDHERKVWSTPSVVGTSSTPADCHSCPVIQIFDDGRIAVCVLGHNSMARWFVTAQPERPDGYWNVSNFGPATYGQCYIRDGVLWWFHRDGDVAAGGAGWGWSESRDGLNWSQFHKLMDCPNGPCPYPMFHMDDSGSIHCFWLYYTGSRWRNFWYCRSDDLGASWHTSTGVQLPVPWEWYEGELVYVGDVHGWQNQISAGTLSFVSGGPGIVDANYKGICGLYQGRWTSALGDGVASMYASRCASVDVDSSPYLCECSGAWNGGIPKINGQDVFCESPAAFPAPVLNGTDIQFVWSAGDKNPGSVWAWGNQ